MTMRALSFAKSGSNALYLYKDCPDHKGEFHNMVKIFMADTAGNHCLLRTKWAWQNDKHGKGSNLKTPAKRMTLKLLWGNLQQMSDLWPCVLLAFSSIPAHSEVFAAH